MNTNFEETMYLVAIVSSIFVVMQFIASFIFSDFESDVDLDCDTSLSASDLLSFKGILHFVVGFTWTITLLDSQPVERIGLALIIGIIFTASLGYVAKFIKKLASEPVPFIISEVENKNATVDFWKNGKGELIYKSDNFMIHIKAESKGNKDYKSGDIVTIIEIDGEKIYVD